MHNALNVIKLFIITYSPNVIHALIADKQSEMLKQQQSNY